MSQQTENSEARLDIVLRVLRDDSWVKEQVEEYLAGKQCFGCGAEGKKVLGQDIYLCPTKLCIVRTFTDKEIRSFKDEAFVDK